MSFVLKQADSCFFFFPSSNGLTGKHMKAYGYKQHHIWTLLPYKKTLSQNFRQLELRHG